MYSVVAIFVVPNTATAMNRHYFVVAILIFLTARIGLAQAPAKVDTSRGDKMLAEYFAAETKKLQEACLADVQTLEDWKEKRGEYRRQLHEMLGLDPLPEKTDLKPVITGRLEQEDFVVEKLYFQSRPGLYVTGNLYLPKKINLEKPLPTILYVCGHSRVLGPDGKTPMGAKAGYQHHGAWYARNGYACLTIDTLQLGEIEGIHHGTHRYGMWWWLNRGYTPAGVEAWNCVRALDYLETRPEIDKTRFGVTGRSGGGAYSWWIAAIDERIKVAVPTAGITDLQNHVVDGCVEGHCDCMFMVNTYRWDYPQVAALVAPRPLLISNTDSDGIFPLDGVVRTFDKVRRIYRLYDKEKKGTSADVALNISPGPHKDTQELNTHEFRWFNHYLKGDDSPIDSRAPKYFKPEELKVFAKLPEDEINTKVHETFLGKAQPRLPRDEADWNGMTSEWQELILKKSVPGFHEYRPYRELGPFRDHFPRVTFVAEEEGICLARIEFLANDRDALPIYVLYRKGLQKPAHNLFHVLDEANWRRFIAAVQVPFVHHISSFEGLGRLPPQSADEWKTLKQKLLSEPVFMAFFAPFGVGTIGLNGDDKKTVQTKRRFYLLGTTIAAEQVCNVAHAVNAIESVSIDSKEGLNEAPITVVAHGEMAAIALYAQMSNWRVDQLELHDPPKTHRDGPYFLNVERFLDMPQAVAMAAERTKIVLYQDDDTGWEYPQAVAKALNWPEGQIQIRRKPAEK
jgi:hypothetical protein